MKNLILNRKTDIGIQSLICNLIPAKTRLDALEGKDYLVVPMVILTQGVHSGSSGPLYYPPEELSKTPESWNYKPIVVYHPEMNGVGLSACSPTIINSRKVGVMMNTQWDKKKGILRSEAWIDQIRAETVDERIMLAVNSGEMMELSTGVFVDVAEDEGEWNGEPYQGIARNYRPDHLALLPDRVGACSIADGAGFLRNQSKELRDLVRKVFAGNELSFDNIRKEINTALAVRLPEGQDGPFNWIENVYSNFFVYERDGKLFRLGYTSSDVGIALSEEQPVEVKRVLEYRTLDGAFVGNQQQGEEMNKKELIEKIVSNEATGFKKADVELLGKFSEDQLTRILNSSTTPKEEDKQEKEEDKSKSSGGTQNSKQKSSEPPKTEEKAEVVGNVIPKEPAKPATIQEYVASAPREIQEVLNNSLDVYNGEKAKLIEGILGNKRNDFTKSDLEARPLGELRRIARLAAGEEPRVLNYSGQGNTAPTSAEGGEEPLVMPAMNFAK